MFLVKKSRVVKKPLLEILREAPASPHIDADLSYDGYYHKTNEGQWLRLKDNIEPTYIWIGKDATISRKFRF